MSSTYSMNRKPSGTPEETPEEEVEQINKELPTFNGNVKLKLLQLPKTWIVLMTIRLLINIFGQRSYIHPDEFFQGVEVIAGNIFNCEKSVFHAWEFQFQNVTNQAGDKYTQEPIRNIALPYIFYGFPLMFLKFLNTLLTVRDYSLFTNKMESSLTMTPVQANTLIYYPRVFMTFCSVIIDFSILKSSELFGFDGSSVLITFATSYLTLVYLTRTFSNTIETMLFSVLIYLVIKSIKSQHVLNDKFLIATEKGNNPVSTLVASTSDLISSTFQADETSIRMPPQKAATLKRMRMFDIFRFDYLGKWIGLIICIGFFNRPTFLFFALIPSIYWLLYGLDTANNWRQFHWFFWHRAFALVRLAVPCLILLVLIDSAYYYKLSTLSELLDLILKRDKSFIITPYNFFVYNFNSDNLKSHGEHPFYLHSVVNCVILFGLNHFVLYLILFKFFWQLFKSVDSRNRDGEEEQQSKYKTFKLNFTKFYQLVINNRFCFLLFSFLTPLVLFSLVTHQEPRFLLPLIIPICLLTGHCIFGKNSYLLLRIVWISFNLIAFIFYGYVHQGGVIPSLNHVQKMYTHVSNLEMDQHVIYYNTYMPPRFLVQAPFSVNIVNNKRFVYEKNKKQFETEIEEGNFEAKFRSDLAVDPPERLIYDLMSSRNTTELYNLIWRIKMNVTSVKLKKKQIKRNVGVFLVAPSVVDSLLELDNGYDEGNSCHNVDSKKSWVRFQKQNQFRFHFSGERLQEQLNLAMCRFSEVSDKGKRTCLEKMCKRSRWTDRWLNAFSLHFYQVIM